MLDRVVGVSATSVEWPASKISSSGSGVVLAWDRPAKGRLGTLVIVTNSHVLGAAISVKVSTSWGDEGFGTVVAFDHDLDVALIKAVPFATVPPTLKQPVRYDTNPTVGARCYSVGAPLGLSGTLADGIVSAVRDDGKRRVVQVTAAASPGSSGGGLFSEAGNLLGIITFKARTGESLNFAIASEVIESTVSQEFAGASESAFDVGAGASRVIGRQRDLAEFDPYREAVRQVRKWIDEAPGGIAAAKVRAAKILALLGRYQNSQFFLNEIATTHADPSVLVAAAQIAGDRIRESNSYRMLLARIAAANGDAGESRRLMLEIATSCMTASESLQEDGKAMHPVRVVDVAVFARDTLSLLGKGLHSEVSQVLRSKGWDLSLNF